MIWIYLNNIMRFLKISLNMCARLFSRLAIIDGKAMSRPGGTNCAMFIPRHLTAGVSTDPV